MALLAAVLALGLGGCSVLKEKTSDDAPARAPAAYALDVEAPGPLRGLLLAYLDVARFRDSPEARSLTAVELDRLIAAAPAQARDLLETEGYFEPEVQVSRVPGSDPVRLRIAVTPGPRTVVTAAQLEVEGELERAAAAGDEGAQEQIESLRRRWTLKPREPFRQGAWTQAKNVSLAQLRAEGWPAATWARTEARVDAAAAEAQVLAVARSGPRYRLGPMTVEGLARYDEETVRHLADFGPGTPYTEQRLLDFQERLQKSGLFEGAVVELDADPATHDAAPVRVRVKELPAQQATIGVGYSANVGPRITFEHLHRKPFGQRWIARNKFELGPALRSWTGELTSHPLEGQYRNLVSGGAERLRAADQLRTTWNARVGRSQDTQRIERLYFLDYTHSRLDTGVGAESSDAVSANAHWAWRAVDDLLLPTRGVALALQGAAGYAVGRQITETGISEGRGPFTRAYVRAMGYLPFPDDETVAQRWYLTVRAEVGQVFARDRVGVPDPFLFRAGGDESVRGYAYRTLGPVVNGVVTSGRMLATGSVEIARPISPKRPAIWWAAFLDAGQAANRWSEFDPVLGYGVGVRWRSPVGPLRVDLAYGQALRRVRLHVSVGLAF